MNHVSIVASLWLCLSSLAHADHATTQMIVGNTIGAKPELTEQGKKQREIYNAEANRKAKVLAEKKMVLDDYERMRRSFEKHAFANINLWEESREKLGHESNLKVKCITLSAKGRYEESSRSVHLVTAANGILSMHTVTDASGLSEPNNHSTSSVQDASSLGFASIHFKMRSITGSDLYVMVRRLNGSEDDYVLKYLETDGTTTLCE